MLLGIAFYYNDQAAYKYVLPLSITGMIIAGYHYGLQKISFLQKFEMCTSGVPCSGQYINWAGFITIPFLSLSAFTIITITMIAYRINVLQINMDEDSN
ncbi:disulfide bond formation protein DsbC [Bacillus canaveralius]|nr:disulfide bond formation protein DsbC [Bacillus canaveralius]